MICSYPVFNKYLIIDAILKYCIVLQALSAHNNLNKDAIFVTSDECWKLGQLDLLSR